MTEKWIAAYFESANHALVSYKLLSHSPVSLFLLNVIQTSVRKSLRVLMTRTAINRIYIIVLTFFGVKIYYAIWTLFFFKFDNIHFPYFLFTNKKNKSYFTVWRIIFEGGNFLFQMKSHIIYY